MSGVKLLNSFVAGVLEFLVIVAVDFDDPDSPFEVGYFGGFGDPVEIYLVDSNVLKGRVH